MFRGRSLKTFVKYLFAEPYCYLIRFGIYPPLRNILLRLVGADVSFSSIIYDTTIFNVEHGSFKNLHIGKNCHIGRGVLIDLFGKINIGDNVVVSQMAQLLSHASVGKHHPLAEKFPEKVATVHLSSGCWIGAGAIILPGVKIGMNSVVGAGSVVTKDVPDFTVVAGVPAKQIASLEYTTL